MGTVIEANFGINNTKNQVMRLTASWCGPCKSYAPLFEKVTGELDIAEWNVATLDVDTDAGKEVAETYAVRGVPTTIVVRASDDRPNVLTGVQSEQELRDAIGL